MGFPTCISGADLVWRGEVQAMKFGTRFVIPRRVAKLEPLGDGFCATFDNGQRVRSGAVVIATGVQYHRPQIDGLAGLEGAGVYYAATENEARHCKNAATVVIGGGNSAGQAAMFPQSLGQLRPGHRSRAVLGRIHVELPVEPA